MYQTEEICLFYMIEKKGQIYEMIYVIAWYTVRIILVSMVTVFKVSMATVAKRDYNYWYSSTRRQY